MWTSGLKLVPLEKRIFEHRKQIPSSKPTLRGNGKFYLHFRASFLFIKKVIKWELDTLNSRDVKIFRSIKSRWWQRATMLFPISRATVRKQFARQGERAGQIFLCDTWPCYQITFSAMGTQFQSENLWKSRYQPLIQPHIQWWWINLVDNLLYPILQPVFGWYIQLSLACYLLITHKIHSWEIDIHIQVDPQGTMRIGKNTNHSFTGLMIFDNG